MWTYPGLATNFDVIPSSIRIARITPWGQVAVLGLTKPGKSWGGVLRIQRGGLFSGVFNRGGGGGGGCCEDASILRSVGDLQTSGAGRAFAGGSTATELTLVVPDGVAKVTFVIPRQSDGNDYGTLTYRAALRVTALVIGNVAAVRIGRECCMGAVPMIWLDRDGHVVKRVGNFNTINRVLRQPKPGLQTPRSRAAEQNPATPNPVWVTPALAGPRTKLEIHFRALLNAAGYNWQISGARCPRFTAGGGELNPNLLRGQLASFNLRSIANQALCPGKYKVSVSVMDLGRHGRHLRHPKPFGRAAFTIK